MATIQWYPGHMAKAFRQIKEKLKYIDIFIELVDARTPWSSKNPQLEEISANKPTLLVLQKADLADHKITAQWLNYYRTHGQPAIAIDVNDVKVNKLITKAVLNVLDEQINSQINKGIQNEIIHAVICGIPNVGKSTLLNRLINKKVAKTGNKPGVTKKEQWLKVNDKLQILDTPGVLWPKFSDQTIGLKLSLIGSIKDSLFAKDDAVLFLFASLRKQQKLSVIFNRYHLNDDLTFLSDVDLLLNITKKLGYKDDYDRACENIINDLRKGKLGKISLDLVDDLESNDINETNIERN